MPSLFGCFACHAVREHAALPPRPPKRNAPPLRILAIGDSLTEGYYSRGFRFAPYTTRLLELAMEAGLTDFEVVKEGVSGERVCPSMMHRTRDLLAAARDSNLRYTHVFILGGINDLHGGRRARDVYRNLVRMYEAALAAGSRVVAMTLFGFRDDLVSLGNAEAERLELNRMLRAYVAKKSVTDKISLVDLAAHFEPLRAETCPPFWDDLIHLTPHGYDVMANILWNEVVDPLLV